MNELLKHLPHDQVRLVGGEARSGADKFIKRYAKAYRYKYTGFPADWDGPYRKGAGFHRNKQMFDQLTHLVAFWDYKSPGTKHMIELTKSDHSRVVLQVYRIVIEDTANGQPDKRWG